MQKVKGNAEQALGEQSPEAWEDGCEKCAGVPYAKMRMERRRGNGYSFFRAPVAEAFSSPILLP